jgi:hypothetical protein
MDQFEDDLKIALRRVDAPASLEGRVLARLRAESASGAAPQRPSRFTAWAMAGGLAFASLAGIGIYRYEQQRKAMAASEQLLLALRVTGQKLDAVRGSLNNQSGNR